MGTLWALPEIKPEDKNAKSLLQTSKSQRASKPQEILPIITGRVHYFRAVGSIKE
jgi:hypothetical protein